MNYVHKGYGGCLAGVEPGRELAHAQVVADSASGQPHPKDHAAGY